MSGIEGKKKFEIYFPDIYFGSEIAPMPLAALFLFLITFGCGKRQPTMTHPPGNGPAPSNRYTGSLYEGNYIWTGAMNLCWTALSQTIIHEPIAVRTETAEALEMADRFNHPVCTTADLDEPSYYIKAGFGPKTLEAINRESRKKFPDKSFGDMDMTLGEDDIISYAYFYKKVAYEIPFTRTDLFFDSAWVKGFEAVKEQKRTIEVLHYENDDRFIIRLRLKSSGDELLLAKGYATHDPAEVVKALDGLPEGDASRLDADDHFMMPLLKLNCRRDYPELTGKPLANAGFTEYVIGVMFENINFELDETGAKAESQAVIGVERSAPTKKTGRYFYLNKPFWVIMKRNDSQNPFFLLGVNTTHIMQPK